MNQRCTKTASRSLVHGMLRITPGYAPAWLFSPDCCVGLDLLCMVSAILFLGSLWLGKALDIPWAWVSMLALSLLYVWYLYMPFKSENAGGVLGAGMDSASGAVSPAYRPAAPARHAIWSADHVL